MLFCLLFCVCFGRHMASAQPCDIKGQTGIFLPKVTNNCFFTCFTYEKKYAKKGCF